MKRPNLKTVFFLIPLIAIPFFISAQSIITGQVGENDIYTDLGPDQSISCYVFPGAENTESLYIDVDQNGINDFVFKSNYFGANGGGTGDIKIFGSEGENLIIAHSETTEVYPGDNYLTVNVADTLNEGTELSRNSIFNSGNSYLYSTYYGPVDSQPYVETWDNEDEHYIGFRIIPKQDTLYGWIRIIKSTNSDGFNLRCIDMACNINEFASIDIKTKSIFSIYPNPANNELFINYPNLEAIESIDIYTISGKLVNKLLLKNNNPSIDISHLPVGSYIIITKMQEFVFRNKFVKI